MGQRIIACAAAETAGSSASAWQLVAAVERAGHPRLGDDAGSLAGIAAAGVPVSEAWACPADVAIDFSLPGATKAGVTEKALRLADAY
jgi:4-hydroxy-tetrahydrodipicolinate reductase